MRLLKNSTRKLESFIGTEIPPYAILSHTWGEEEVTFDDVIGKQGDCHQKKGYEKIAIACSLALSHNLEYVWVDTCCIDKSSSSELTEAINSMFRWYANAKVCFVHLSDVPKKVDSSYRHTFQSCRWFTRGWTLQELIAPSNVLFYDQHQNLLGTKHSLAEALAEITGIDIEILQEECNSSLLYSLPVARRMAWAAHRQTTRVEDMAYCLLGLFDVSLPLIYGEGEKAFSRLQEEIIRQSNDLSIFAWKSNSAVLRGIFANSPAEFVDAGQILNVRSNIENPEFSITNKGIKIVMDFIGDQGGTSDGRDEDDNTDFVLPLRCTLGQISPPVHGHLMRNRHIGIYLSVCGPGVYVRSRAKLLWEQGMLDSKTTGAASERYILKHITPGSDPVSVRKRMRYKSFRFPFPFYTQHYRYESTHPATWWNPEGKVFYRDMNPSFCAMHVFRSRLDNGDNQFAIIFGVDTRIGGNEEARITFVNRQFDPPLFDDAATGNVNFIELLGRLGASTKIDLSGDDDDSTPLPEPARINVRDFFPETGDSGKWGKTGNNGLLYSLILRQKKTAKKNAIYLEMVPARGITGANRF